jgi:hypothetical protein
MTGKSIRRIAVLLALLQCPGFIASASAKWTYLGLYQTGTSWGFLVRQYKFACATEARGTYVYFSQYSDYAQATADATKRCK